jgi:hypothetical protein
MSPEMFRKLASLGLSHEQMAGVLEVFKQDAGERLATAEEGKEKARERWRRWKNKQGTNVGKRLQTDTNVSKPLVRVEGSSLEEEIKEKEGRKKDSAAKPRGDLDAFKSELSSILDPARIEALVAVRRKKGATFSAHAGSLLVSALNACPDPQVAADEMVLRNWTGIKPEWLESRTAPAQRSTAPPARSAHNEILDAIIRGENSVTASSPTIDASYERSDGGSATGPVRLYALPSGRR